MARQPTQRALSFLRRTWREVREVGQRSKYPNEENRLGWSARSTRYINDAVYVDESSFVSRRLRIPIGQ